MDDEKKFNTSVLGGIILSSFSKGNTDLPTDFFVVENEIKCGTIDYLQEIENLSLENPFYRSGEILTNNRRIIEEKFRLRMNSDKIKEILSPVIKESLEEITKWEVNSGIQPGFNYPKVEVTPSYGIISWKSKFFEYFKNLMGEDFSCSGKICSLPYSVVLNLQNKFLPSLSQKARLNLEGIGKKVMPYRMRDLKKITENSDELKRY